MPLLEVTKPAGPFAVGQCDCMWLDAAPAQLAPGAQSADDGVAVPKHKLMLRIYYPVEPDVAAQHAEASWLPNDYGVRSYAEAYADAMFKGVGGTLVGTLGFGPLMKNVKSQTVEGAPLASAQALPRVLPVIYSHGLLGNRSCYSHPCIDLASRGFIVFAVEHSDGSATCTVFPVCARLSKSAQACAGLVQAGLHRRPTCEARTRTHTHARTHTHTHTRTQDKTVVEFKHAPRAAVIPGKHVRIKNGFNKSLIPANLPRHSTQHDLRHGQLRTRISEMVFIADCLQRLQSGSADPALQPLPATFGDKGLQGRLDLSRLVCMGHSFGALTSICAATEDARFKACVAHDAWLFPAGEDMAQSRLRVPTLFLLGDTFDMLWPVWGRKMLANWVGQSRRAGVDVRALHLHGCRHQNFADFPVLIPEMSQTLGFAGQTPPGTLNQIMAECDYSFLCHHLRLTPVESSSPASVGAPLTPPRDQDSSRPRADEDQETEATPRVRDRPWGWGGGWFQAVGASTARTLNLAKWPMMGVVGSGGLDRVSDPWEVPAGVMAMGGGGVVTTDVSHESAGPVESIAVGSFTYQVPHIQLLIRRSQRVPVRVCVCARASVYVCVCVCMYVHSLPFIHPLVCVCVCVCVRTYTDIHTQMHMHSSRPARWPRRWASKRLHETRRQAGTGGTVLEIRWNQSSRGLGRQFCGAATSQKAPKAPGAAGGMRST